MPTDRERLTTRRILKVNHAGETGAINIYGAQIAMARRFFPSIVPLLQEMREDEVRHCRLFREAMPARYAKPCRVMTFWVLGGFVLGFGTAIMGSRAVWVCTEAVEATVHRHLDEQLHFLANRDSELYALIDSIRAEELAHLNEAMTRQHGRGWQRALLYPVIVLAVETLIWLSTWGDSVRMRRDLKSAHAT